MTSEPKAALRHYDEQTRELVRALIVDLGINRCELARQMGVSRSTLYRVLDGERALPAHWLFLMPDALRVALAQAVVGARYEVQEAPEYALESGAWEGVVAMSEAVTVATQAYADGLLDRAEATELRRVGPGLRKAAASIEALCDRAFAHGVVRVSEVA